LLCDEENIKVTREFNDIPYGQAMPISLAVSTSSVAKKLKNGEEMRCSMRTCPYPCPYRGATPSNKETELVLLVLFISFSFIYFRNPLAYSSL
jgi:hypothetical protein